MKYDTSTDEYIRADGSRVPRYDFNNDRDTGRYRTQDGVDRFVINGRDTPRDAFFRVLNMAQGHE